MLNPKIFKAYDIRAEYGTEIDADGVRRIARAFAATKSPKTVGIGHDMRVSGPEIANAFAEELAAMGVNVIELGLTSTDASYYASGTMEVDYVVQITASHNPPRYNGFKISRKGMTLEEKDIFALRDAAVAETVYPNAATPGTRTQKTDTMEQFVAFAVSLVDKNSIKPLKLLVDAGNGMAGMLIPLVQKHLPVQVTPLYFELDGNFPNHLANPLIPEAQADAKKALAEGQYDLGVLFDGDGDRMFLMDEHGNFISGTVTTAMVAKEILANHPGETILYNGVCGRVVPETIEKSGGKSQRVRTGHSLIKAEMTNTGAIFAGEHSGHYYFREFFKADSGLISMLFVLQLLSKGGRATSEVVKEFDIYPASGEINFATTEKDAIMADIEAKYGPSAQSVDQLDGLAVWYPDWWVSVRGSNTQPVVRLNVEANTAEILAARTQELQALIESHGGVVTHE